jgi:hypothetical protein
LAKVDTENQIRGLFKNLGLVIGQAKMNVFSVPFLWPPASARRRVSSNGVELARGAAHGHDILPPSPRTYSYLGEAADSGDARHNEEVPWRTIDRFVMAITSLR